MDISEQHVPSLRQALLRDIGAVVSSSCGLIYFVFIVLSHRYTESVSETPPWPMVALGFANLGWFLIEIVTMLTNPKRRALHDLIAGTVVVRIDPCPVGPIFTPESSISASGSR